MDVAKDETERKRGEGDLLEDLLNHDSWPLEITTKPLEHSRAGCRLARVPLQHDLYILLGV